MMKLFLQSMLVALSLLLLASCEKETTSSKSQAELLMGKWQIETVFDLNNVDVTTACDLATSKQFSENNSLQWFESTEDANGECYEFDYNEEGVATYTIDDEGLLNLYWESTDGSSSHQLEAIQFEVKDDRLLFKFSPSHKGVQYKRIP